LFHVAAHASDTRFLFLSDSERELFLDSLAATFERFELGVVTDTLLCSHYHLVLLTPDARVSNALPQLHATYSRRHNKGRGTSAQLFRSRFFARELTSDEELLGACRYAARNPVEAAVVGDPRDWRWSSARAHAGLEPPRIPLHEEPLQAALGSRRWRIAYRECVALNASQPG